MGCRISNPRRPSSRTLWIKGKDQELAQPQILDWKIDKSLDRFRRWTQPLGHTQDDEKHRNWREIPIPGGKLPLHFMCTMYVCVCIYVCIHLLCVKHAKVFYKTTTQCPWWPVARRLGIILMGKNPLKLRVKEICPLCYMPQLLVCLDIVLRCAGIIYNDPDQSSDWLHHRLEDLFNTTEVKHRGPCNPIFCRCFHTTCTCIVWTIQMRILNHYMQLHLPIMHQHPHGPNPTKANQLKQGK